MPNFKPTRATALVYDNGHVCALSPGRSAGAAFTSHDCIIMPAPTPIAEAPKDEVILGYNEDDQIWQPCWWVKDPKQLQCIFGGPAWTNGEMRDDSTRMERVYLKWWMPMLPPPAPRGEEVPRG